MIDLKKIVLKPIEREKFIICHKLWYPNSKIPEGQGFIQISNPLLFGQNAKTILKKVEEHPLAKEVKNRVKNQRYIIPSEQLDQKWLIKRTRKHIKKYWSKNRTLILVFQAPKEQNYFCLWLRKKEGKFFTVGLNLPQTYKNLFSWSNNQRPKKFLNTGIYIPPEYQNLSNLTIPLPKKQGLN